MTGDWPKTGNCCANGGTAKIEQYFGRLEYAKAQGYLNRTVFCFGYLIGRSELNPNAWTKDMLRDALGRLKAAYPELAGVLMYGHGPKSGFPNATNHSTPATEQATLDIIRDANELMLEFYPD